ncbi:M24 family metallopeptidase [Gordonia jinghuaiqii]|uniref:Aminopeptidase P family protein n=1 Tax=Gordonia jinghuaiqii TaxID=2758710 RepID=A0A7D7LUV8_9ACTN|nr:Xaa-Pro peptidase family protein [Gordonia jinghuaiqii]MCR5976385.1 M24 family metallopeptidase [Gordonia jinghuaiqii]QMT03600.1 aminopeptidase P family protein [Gordonia jinghuaiqii]
MAHTHDTAGRRNRLRDTLAARTDGTPVDAFVVSDLVNVRYLTGFTGSNAAVLIDVADPAADRIATDGRYLTQVAAQVPDVEPVIERACVPALVDHARTAGASRIGFEADEQTVATHRALSSSLEGSGVELVPLTGVVQGLRAVKEPGEIELLRAACAIGDAALAAIIADGVLRAGTTEREAARALEWEMYRLGADGIAFETIVAAGAHSAIPHHRPTHSALADGDLVKIDFGAIVDGYHSDMTRTYVLRRAAPWQRDLYELVATAQAAGCAALTPGAELRAVDAAAREVIADAGHGEHYVHGLGHGVGLQIHEAPGIGKLATGTLPCGAAVTVEPGVYLPGWGGVRIEDTLVVTTGDPDLLTATDKTFTVI